MIAKTTGVVLTLMGAGCALTYDADLVIDRDRSLYGLGPSRGASGPTQEPAAELRPGADLDECLRYGLYRSPDLRSAYEGWRAALERVPQVSTLPEPVLSFAHFVEDVQTRTGPQRNRLGLSQGLPWPGKLRLQGEAAIEHAEAMWARVDARRLAVIRTIKRAWYEYAFLARAIRIDEDNLRLLQQLDPIVQSKIRGGAGQDDLLRLQVEIGKLENDLETLKKLGPTIRARLNAAMNRPSEAPLRMPELQEPRTAPVDVSDLADRLARRNPELESLRREIERSAKLLERARLEGLPDLVIGADWFDTGSAAVPGTPGSGDDPLAVRVQMTLPIWRGKYAAARREAERNRAAASSTLDDRHNTLRADLELFAYQLDDAARQLALYRDSLLPRARQSFEVVRQSYRAGNKALLDVIDAERVLLAFQKAYWRACSSYEQSLADLEAICGGEIR